MYQPIIQPTLRQSEDQLHSTPKYVLKVPIPQLQSLSGMQPQISSFQNSGQKDNPLNTVTFDKRWNPENQVSDKKNILSQSAKKVNTENDDGSSVVEKSFSEAAQKILKIKNLELENKVSLLVIENERLTTFLNDQFQENEKLTNELQNCQQNLSELSKVYEDKLNVVLLENSKLIKINSTLENKNEQLNQQFLKFRSEKENEVLQTKSEWANKYQSQINSIDEKHKYEITNQVEKLQFEKSEFSILIQEQQQKLREFQIELKTKDLQLTEFENIKVDFANKINRIEVMSQTILAQENRINDLENRLDIMVADNKQLQDVNEQLNQTQRILQGTLEERQITFDMEQNKLKEFYEQELKGINNKSKQQNDDLKLFHQEQMNSQRIQIENELIKELELLKIEIETKQNELNNNLLLWQEKEKNLIQENKKEQQIKDGMINTLKISNKSLQDQMNELQLLVQKMQEDFEQKFEQKEQELVKMAKSVHIKEQTIKQTSVRLDEICKQIKIMEDQRDELSIEINKKTELIKELEQKLDIVIKENDNFLNQLKITDSQLQLSQQQYQNLVKASEQKIEDIKLTYSLEVQASIEQCITQYQETIKYEQDHSDKLMKNLKKQEEKAKHYELLNEQQLNDMEKLNKRIEELLDVCEQSGQRLLQLEGIMKEKDYQIEQLNIKLEQITF